jgi:hypothetical protein
LIFQAAEAAMQEAAVNEYFNDTNVQLALEEERTQLAHPEFPLLKLNFIEQFRSSQVKGPYSKEIGLVDAVKTNQESSQLENAGLVFDNLFESDNGLVAKLKKSNLKVFSSPGS